MGIPKLRSVCDPWSGQDDRIMVPSEILPCAKYALGPSVVPRSNTTPGAISVATERDSKSGDHSLRVTGDLLMHSASAVLYCCSSLAVSLGRTRSGLHGANMIGAAKGDGSRITKAMLCLIPKTLPEVKRLGGPGMEETMITTMNESRLNPGLASVVCREGSSVSCC